MLRLAGFLGAFAAAIWALNAGWTSFRSTWETPSPGGWALTLGYLAVFLAAFLYVGFQQYAADRAAGRVRRRIGLYERLLRQ
ncbi:MAG TPA: hypothetical protein VGR24_04370 [bacterium]|jgi:hypothetical protein|nr:hypothetical protein [bacterium]